MREMPFSGCLRALSTRARCRARAGANREGLLDLPDVGCLKTLRTASYFELDPVTLSKALEALGLDGAVVDEHVLAALLCDEPVTLRIVEPLHLSVSHTSNLSLGGLQAPCSRHRGGGAFRHWKANKNAARTGPARRVSRSHNCYLTPCVPEPMRRMTRTVQQVNRIIARRGGPGGSR